MGDLGRPSPAHCLLAELKLTLAADIGNFFSFSWFPKEMSRGRSRPLRTCRGSSPLEPLSEFSQIPQRS